MRLSRVFIGGPPRTGTSLLIRYLDWHPELFVFPFEPALLAAVHYGDLVGSGVARGKEFVFGDRNALAGWGDRLAGEFAYAGRDILQRVDTDSFTARTDALLRAHAGRPASLELLRGIGAALVATAPALRQRYGGGRAIGEVWKLPFHVDALSGDLLRGDPAAGVILLRREPVARYASAKARHLRQAGDTLVHPAGPLDYATFQADLAIAARHLAEAAQRDAPQRVLALDYETLAESPARAVAAVLRFIGVPDAAETATESMIGAPIATPSAFGTAAERARGGFAGHVEAITSAAEREYVRARCIAAFADGAIRHAAAAAMRAAANERFLHEDEAARELRLSALSDQAAPDPAPVTRRLLSILRSERPSLI